MRNSVRPHSSLGYRPPALEASERGWPEGYPNTNIETGSLLGAGQRCSVVRHVWDRVDILKAGMRRAITMFSLVFAGEAVFFLPFHISRFFRPTFVEVFGITQTQLGVLGFTYGVVAMFAYLLGGGLADRFDARKLLAFSLVATATAGLYLATIPNFAELRWLFAFWGVSTILPFWSALIRATREWGGAPKQGSAFGILDGGRGGVAAAMATIALLLLGMFLPENDAAATLEQKRVALRSIIFLYTVTCLIAAGCVWLFVPESKLQYSDKISNQPRRDSGRLKQVIRMPAVWLHAVIIMAAYSAYKGVDFFSQYAHDVWGWSDVESARLSTSSAWIRPVAAIAAGFLADRLSSSRVIMGSFLLTGVGYAALRWIPPAHAFEWLLWTNICTISLGIFALRGIYFALLEEAQIPRVMTGTAVGVVCFIGFVPEIFIPPLGGWLIDRWSGGQTGYHVFFALLVGGCAFGIAAAALLRARRSH